MSKKAEAALDPLVASFETYWCDELLPEIKQHIAYFESIDLRGLSLDQGQHETYLNIVGADSIVKAVTRCWESARSERALEYRRKQGLSVARPQLAVFVQQLVASDVSAVVFSANPVTGSRDEILINASWGLGESIVGGTVTPDTSVVRKTDLAISRRIIVDKQRMTVAVSGGHQRGRCAALLARPGLAE